MLETVAPSLGITTDSFDPQRDAAIRAFRSSFMVPAVEKGSPLSLFLIEKINETSNSSSITNFILIFSGIHPKCRTQSCDLQWQP